MSMKTEFGILSLKSGLNTFKTCKIVKKKIDFRHNYHGFTSSYGAGTKFIIL